LAAKAVTAGPRLEVRTAQNHEQQQQAKSLKYLTYCKVVYGFSNSLSSQTNLFVVPVKVRK